ncbi:MAG: hypothetical protein M1834_004798 [Cirrosporium novae-zelandiae]|nr:MAG: hypothetical protein M1834_004798 [Cirrosporium novae-zelandiae]
MAVGLLLTRRRRNRLGIPPSEFRAWDAVVVFSICANTFLLVMPWYPPSTGRNGGDVSFWYATYCVVGIAVEIPPIPTSLVICGVYYWLWIHLLPKLGRYQICQVVLELDDGAAMTHKLIKVPDENLADWDAEHDATGRVHHRSWTEVK